MFPFGSRFKAVPPSFRQSSRPNNFAARQFPFGSRCNVVPPSFLSRSFHTDWLSFPSKLKSRSRGALSYLLTALPLKRSFQFLLRLEADRKGPALALNSNCDNANREAKGSLGRFDQNVPDSRFFEIGRQFETCGGHGHFCIAKLDRINDRPRPTENGPKRPYLERGAQNEMATVID